MCVGGSELGENTLQRIMFVWLQIWRVIDFIVNNQVTINRIIIHCIVKINSISVRHPSTYTLVLNLIIIQMLPMNLSIIHQPPHWIQIQIQFIGQPWQQRNNGVWQEPIKTVHNSHIWFSSVNELDEIQNKKNLKKNIQQQQLLHTHTNLESKILM